MEKRQKLLPAQTLRDATPLAALSSSHLVNDTAIIIVVRIIVEKLHHIVVVVVAATAATRL
jgi:hypothetical protein